MPSGRRQHVKPNDPCPACGGRSWCFWIVGDGEAPDGRRRLVCKRQAVAGDSEIDSGAVAPVAGYKPARHTGKSGGVVYRPVDGDGRVAGSPARTKSPDERAAEEAQAAQWRARSRRSAARIWGLASRRGVGHPRALAYLAARGVDPAMLPVWPSRRGDADRTQRWLAYLERCPREVFDADGKPVYEPPKPGGDRDRGRRVLEFLPALVCAMIRLGELEGRLEPYVAGVQRIYLDPRWAGHGVEHAGKLPAELGGGGERGKMAKGDCAGAFVSLAPRGRMPAGEPQTLVLCEGVETGLAIAAATWRGGECGPAVWACVSTSGLKNLELHPAVFGEASGLRRVVIAGDYDSWKPRTKHRPGPTDAVIAANRIARLCSHLRVEVALPSGGVAPSLLGPPGSDAHEGGDEDGAAILSGGKTVDWLDVLVGEGEHGPAAVVRGVLGGGAVVAAPPTPPPPPPAGVAGGGDAGAPVPTRAQDDGTRASPVAPAGGAGGEGGGGGRVVGTSSGWGDGEGARPILSDNPAVVAMEYLWSECRPRDGTGRRFTLARWKSNWYEWVGTHWAVLPEEVLDARLWTWCSGFDHRRERKAGDVVKPFHVKRDLVSAVRQCIIGHVSVLADELGVWLPPVLPEGGDVRDRVAWGSTVQPKGPRPALRDELGDVLGFANGWVSLREMVETRRCTLRPHTTDHFVHACAPYALPVEAVQRMLDGEDADTLWPDVCPTWWACLNQWGGEECVEWSGVLQLMFGDALRSDRSMEKIFLLVGPRRSGKTTVTDTVLAGIVGRDAFAAINYQTFENRFGFAPLVGKRVAVAGDAEFGKRDDPGRIVEGMKLISGQSTVIVEEKGKQPYSGRLGCRVWITSNTVPDQLRDSSSALADRFVVLPFRTTFINREDSSIKRDRLPAELPGIAVWAIQGAVRMAGMREPRIAMTKRGEEIHAEFVLSSSPMLKFMTDCARWAGSVPPARESAYTLVSDLYRRYQEWCEDEGIAALGLGRFGHQLRAVIPDLTITQPEELGRKRAYRGIELLEVERPQRGLAYPPLPETAGSRNWPPV